MPQAQDEGDPGTQHSNHSPPIPLIIPEIRLPFSGPPPRVPTVISCARMLSLGRSNTA